MENKEAHILVIRLSAMGDVAMTIPVLKALIRAHPHLKITVLTRAFFAPMFLQLKNVSVYEADVKGRHKGFFGLRRLYKELKRQNFTAVADLHNVLRSNILKRFFSFSKTPFIQVDKGRKEKNALTAAKNKVYRQLKTTHQRYADVFKKLGYDLRLDLGCCLSKEKLTENALKITPKDHKKWIGIAPFAAFSGKTYPIKRMEKVIARLNGTNDYSILLFGGGEEEKKVLQAWENKYINCVSLVKKIDFIDELSVISNLDLMVSMDSGNGHLSAMYGVPTITVWGVTHPFAGFYPYGQNMENSLLADREKFPLIPTSVYGNKFPDGYEKAMETIEAKELYNKIIKELN